MIGSDFTTIHDQPSPEGSPDDKRTTTYHPPRAEHHHRRRAETTTTTVSPTTTSTVIGYSTGEPPEGHRLRLGRS